MKVTVNWDYIAEIGETEGYKSWFNYKEIPYGGIFTTVENLPSLKVPHNSTIRVHVGKSIQNFYAYALMPVVEVKPLEEWM